MKETLHFFCNNGSQTLSKLYFPSSHLDSFSGFRTRLLRFQIHVSKSSISLPQKPFKTPQIPSLPPEPQPTLLDSHSDPHSQFREKMLYLESIGIDLFSLVDDYPPIVSSSLNDIKATVELMRSMGFTPIEFRRICGMCPELLTSRASDIAPVFTFLLREANVNGSDLRRVIYRRPRLLVCNVEKQLRPTLYFLQRIGITDVEKHTSLLSCSVEKKFIPRIEYFEKIGFSYRDAISMVRRFPQIFCYSIKDNLEPKFNYFVMEMGRDLKELKEFPQYFSFSLGRRIRARHQMCVEKGVCFPLPVMLKTSEARFRSRLEINALPKGALVEPIWTATPS